MSDAPMNDAEEDYSPPGQPWKLYLLLGVAAIGVFGVITWALGLGPFAYRQIYYGTSRVYILNVTDHPVQVTLDSGSAFEVVPQGIARKPILGGTTTITTTDMAGKVIEEVEIFADGLPVAYNIEGGSCLVVSDVKSFYNTGKRGHVEVTKTYDQTVRTLELPTHNVVWPRETTRDKVLEPEKGVPWLEIVACALIDESERPILVAHLTSQMQQRQKRQKMLELQKKMIEGGSEAVDKAVGVKTEAQMRKSKGLLPKSKSDGDKLPSLDELTKPLDGGAPAPPATAPKADAGPSATPDAP